MRAAATPSTIRALMDMNSLVDVRDALATVRVPTLVLHRIGDGMFRVDDARYIAEHVTGAQLQLLDGDDHFCAGDPDQILDAIEPFLAGLRAPVEPARALAAVVAVAGERGDAVTAGLAAAGGRLRHDPAGRAVLLFDGPATAVRAGLAHLGGEASLGVTVAEITRDVDQVEGHGVQVAGSARRLRAAGLGAGLGDRRRAAQRVRRGAGAGRCPSTTASRCCASCPPDARTPIRRPITSAVGRRTASVRPRRRRSTRGRRS